MAWSLKSALGAFGDYMSLWGTLPGMSVTRRHGSWLFLTGLPVPDFNMGCVWSGPGDHDALAEVVAGLSAAGVPGLVLVEDREAASAAGLSLVADMPIMMWEQGPPAPAPARRDIRSAATCVRPARTAEDLDGALGLVSLAFSIGLEHVRAAYDPRSLEPDWPVQVWVAERDGVLVGSGTAIHAGSHCGVFSMATRAESAGTGVGRSVIETIHADGCARGVRTFVLGATGAGYPLYERVGYRTLGTVGIAVTGEITG